MQLSVNGDMEGIISGYVCKSTLNQLNDVTTWNMVFIYVYYTELVLLNIFLCMYNITWNFTPCFQFCFFFCFHISHIFEVLMLYI